MSKWDRFFSYLFIFLIGAVCGETHLVYTQLSSNRMYGLVLSSCKQPAKEAK